MVKLLDTSHCSAELSDLVKNAQTEIILVSPYLQISPRLFDLLKEASLRNISITLIYRNDKLSEKDSTKFKEQKDKLLSLNVKMSSLENLHAKCYLNDSMAVITSMNLYQYSQENNIEFGICIRKEEDPGLYNETYNEMQRIYRISQFDQPDQLQTVKNISSSKSKTEPAKNSKSESSEPSLETTSDNDFIDLISNFVSGSKFYCIRCGVSIEENPDKPFCKKCNSSWKRYKNEEFEEKYCLSCGEEVKTTYAKPVCKKCYKSKIKKVKK